MAIDVRYVGTRLDERLDDRELERDQHLRERIPRRVQARAGQPAGARRRRLRHQREPGLLVRLSRPRDRHVAAADLPGVLRADPGVARRRRRRVQRRRRSSPTAHGPGISASTNRIRSTPATTCTPTRRSAPTRSAAGVPANFFVLNPDVDQANITRRCGADEVQRAPGRLPPPALARPQRVGQLHLRQNVRNATSTRSPRSRHDPGRRRRAARVQDDVVPTSCRWAAGSASARTSTRC